MDRLFTVALVAIVASTAFAGCFGGNDDEGTTPTPTPDNTTTTPTPSPTPTTPEPTEPEMPADQTVTDSGAIAGQFDKTWDLAINDARYKSSVVQFNLTPSQDGAPITARVFVEFVDSAGASLKSATIGLNGPPSVEWSFAPGELAVGTYTLKATAEPGQSGAPGIPSVGYANYDLFMLAAYR